MDCPHLTSAVQLTVDWLQRLRSDVLSDAWRCAECRSPAENWLCLHCGQVLCGRYVNQHAVRHAQQPDRTDHCVCLNPLSGSVYCYRCDEFVNNDTAGGRLAALRSVFPVDDDENNASDDPCEAHPDETTATTEHSKKSRRSESEASATPPTPAAITSAKCVDTGKTLHETRSTSSSDSGLGVDEFPAIPNAHTHVPAVINSVPELAGPNGGRTLRPRKRTASTDSTTGVAGIAATKPTKPSSAPTAAKRKLLRKVVGLRNLGNTCFMNSVLQSLSNIQEFSCYFNALPSLDATGAGAGSGGGKPKRVYHSRSLKENQGGALGGHGSSSDANVVEELRKILTNLSHGGDGSKAISPECLFLVIWKVVPQFRGHRQHDAHEFLRYMLDRLHTELQNVTVPTAAPDAVDAAASGSGGGKLQLGPATSGLEAGSIMFKGRSSIVTSVFGGTLQSEVRCLICGTESKKHDPFLDLSLDIPERFYKEPASPSPAADGGPATAPSSCHIADCLSSFTEIEELAETELYYCSACKCKQKSTKRFWIRRLPNVLCLHIKRFRWNNFFRTKIDLRIQFPITEMDMSQFVLSGVGPETRRSAAATNVYDLAAVIVHHGNGSSCGHYTSYAINNGTWLHFNDHTVKEVQLSAVEECKPYILFYIRRDPNASKS